MNKRSSEQIRNMTYEILRRTSGGKELHPLHLELVSKAVMGTLPNEDQEMLVGLYSFLQEKPYVEMWINNNKGGEI